MEITSYLLGKKAGGGSGPTPTGTINITENGTHDVTNYASANVNVSGGSSEYNSLIVANYYSGDGVGKYIQKISKDFQISGNSAMNLFKGCFYLKEVGLFDTSNITNTASMFESCRALQNVPLFDLSSVTASGSMFYDCLALKEIPQFDTSSMKGGYRMFYGCTALETIPVLDTSSMTNGMLQMFSNCNSLTNASLKNILQMCLNCPVTASASKTLAYIGLSQTQATTCTTFAEWTDLANDGWTTGYES